MNIMIARIMNIEASNYFLLLPGLKMNMRRLHKFTKVLKREKQNLCKSEQSVVSFFQHGLLRTEMKINITRGAISQYALVIRLAYIFQFNIRTCISE
jgi:hypothetical protein